MDEENKIETENYKKGECTCHKHPVIKHVCVGILVFAGAFSAFYVVADWHFKQMFDPMVQMRRMEKMMQRDTGKIEREFQQQARRIRQLESNSNTFINMEREPDKYKITVDLRPFDNDEKNVEVLASGNILTIRAEGASAKKGHEQILKISQNYMFDEDVNLKDLTKTREGNDLIIYVPSDNT